MYKFSRISLLRLKECHLDLEAVMLEGIKYFDFSVLCGHRGEIEQMRAYNTGKSRAKFGQSKHNLKPSKAIDIAPYPINWQNIDEFKKMAIVIKSCAKKLKINISWGGDWKTFKDYPHFELK